MAKPDIMDLIWWHVTEKRKKQLNNQLVDEKSWRFSRSEVVKMNRNKASVRKRMFRIKKLLDHFWDKEGWWDL